MKKRLGFILCFVLFTFLVGCTSISVSPNGHWTTGRLVVRNGDEAFYANFSWESTADKDRIDFYNPLGQMEARIEVDYHEGCAVHAQLERAGHIERSDNPEAIQLSKNGPLVPINQLRWWMQGQTAPGNAQVETIENGKLVLQDGWRVEMHYDAVSSAEPLPLKRLELSRGPVSIRIVISG